MPSGQAARSAVVEILFGACSRCSATSKPSSSREVGALGFAPPAMPTARATLQLRDLTDYVAPTGTAGCGRHNDGLARLRLADHACRPT
jgi:hypothetical protein